ncbi:MAG: isoprenylcysteine carboxylmethyltransferase family protein [Pseudomonadota bacterium]|nr:isoprenylcysteine carboxylmethyltransferase family protein [Pseudomonadota bacterium]
MSASLSPTPFNQRRRLLVIQFLSVFALVALLLSRPAWREDRPFHEFIEMTGLALVLMCVFGRLWSILYVGNRKNAVLVTSGPYSITRNPLYLFSTIGATGIGLMFGSVVVATTMGLLSYLVFRATAAKEAVYLRNKFANQYRSYAARTPLFWPDFRLYQDIGETSFSPDALKKTFLDALYFLALFPVIEGLEYIQTVGYLPTVLWLY